MNNTKIPSSKRQHYNRFAYLLEPTKEQQKSIPEKQFTFFSINPCNDTPCSFKNIETQVTQQQSKLQLDKQTRKPLKYELQSKNYELFKQKIQHKSSVSSFVAYTPQMSLDKEEFSINNQISTIEYTKSNEIHTHRNLFESILEDEAPLDAEISQIDLKQTCIPVSIEINDNKKSLMPKNLRKKPLQSQLIKLELSQSDEDESHKFDHTFPKKHLRTLTEGAYDEKEYKISTAQKSFRFSNYIHKPQLESVQITDPSKDYSLESTLINQVLKPKRQSKLTIATLKTKKMSQKLQQSSDLEFHNSISLTPKNSQAPSLKRSIKLGRRTTNKI